MDIETANLRQLLVEREKLHRDLQDIDARIATLGRIYWRNRGYTVMPRIEKLRDAILGERK
jgi:hypothetical protein